MSLLSLTLPLPDCIASAEVPGARGLGAGVPDAGPARSAIAELRRQLAAPGVLAHPAVRRELRELEDQLAVKLSAGRLPGRHRAVAAVTDGNPDAPDRIEVGLAEPGEDVSPG
ncbi:MAG TPA: hypothetical protein VF843_09355 [Streptosporangiaceae bacterium]